MSDPSEEPTSFVSHDPKDRQACVLCVVDRAYQKFLPMLVWSAHRSHPSLSFLLVTRGGFRRDVRRLLDELAERCRIELREYACGDLPDRYPSDKAIARFLYDDPTLDEFEYVWIPDTDVVVATGEDGRSLVDRHLGWAEARGLPYCNVIRPNCALPRMVGVHFLIRQPYLERVRPVMSRYRSRFALGTIPRPINDEHVLYRMIQRSGLPLPPAGPHPFYTHGLHLGLWRKRRRSDRSDQVRREVGCEHWVRWYFRLKRDPGFERFAAPIRGVLQRMEADYRSLPAAEPPSGSERSHAPAATNEEPVPVGAVPFVVGEWVGAVREDWADFVGADPLQQLCANGPRGWRTATSAEHRQECFDVLADGVRLRCTVQYDLPVGNRVRRWSRQAGGWLADRLRPAARRAERFRERLRGAGDTILVARRRMRRGGRVRLRVQRVGDETAGAPPDEPPTG